MIPITEIFGPTIQGEGPDSGLKSIFVRVAGCDFHCVWCDSKFSWDVSSAKQYNYVELENELFHKCKDTKCRSVIFTGGNPCLYKDLSKVIEYLNDVKIKVGIETQGSVLPNWLIKVDLLVISPKAPSSRQKDVLDNIYNFISDDYCRPKNICIKIPVFNESDFEFAYTYYDKFKDYLSDNLKFYLMVGNDNVNEYGSIKDRILLKYEELINKVMDSSMDKVYIMPQIHTLVWGNKQGV